METIYRKEKLSELLDRSAGGNKTALRRAVGGNNETVTRYIEGEDIYVTKLCRACTQFGWDIRDFFFVGGRPLSEAPNTPCAALPAAPLEADAIRLQHELDMERAMRQLDARHADELHTALMAAKDEQIADLRRERDDLKDELERLRSQLMGFSPVRAATVCEGYTMKSQTESAVSEKQKK